MLASTFLISAAPKPVAVRLCLGREIPSGPTGPWMSEIGADVEGFLSRVWVAMVDMKEGIDKMDLRGGKGGRQVDERKLKWKT